MLFDGKAVWSIVTYWHHNWFRALLFNISLIYHLILNKETTTLQFYAVRWPQDYGWGSSSSSSYFSLLLLLFSSSFCYSCSFSSSSSSSCSWMVYSPGPTAQQPRQLTLTASSGRPPVLQTTHHHSTWASQSRPSLPLYKKCCLAWSRSPPYHPLLLL